MSQHAQRLRQLAARTGLDGIAEEMRAIADELDSDAPPAPAKPMTAEQRGVSAEYWGSLAQQKADLDTRRGVSMPVSYYASDVVGAALAHYGITDKVGGAV